ncbi:8619_t:CDS:1, partial [Ambispora leptoticha]
SRIRQYNGQLDNGVRTARGSRWVPVLAITGFASKKDATQFESSAKELAKKREFNEYATLYQGKCPATVVKRILAARCLL